MSKTIIISIVFALYGCIILFIALIASRKHQNVKDFVLAGRNLSPILTGLGVGASDMSSWLLMALPGAIYTFGFSYIWMPVALLLGATLNWLLVAKKLRLASEKYNNSLTLPGYLEAKFNDSSTHILKLVIAFALVIFFTFYGVAGFVSAAKLLNLIFGLKYGTGLLIVATVVIIYTMLGGFLAISWADLFQGLLILFALLIVPVATYNKVSISFIINNLVQFSEHLNFTKNLSVIGGISLLGWGLGYFGQPHILVRFMAIKDPHNMHKAAIIHLIWMSTALLAAMLVGFLGIFYYLQQPLLDAELVFLKLSQDLFNPWVTGILLSAVLSAIMSTIAALVLLSATSIVNDLCSLKYSEKKLLLINRIALVLVVLVIVYISYNYNLSILSSVAFPWCGLGASFGPVILLSIYWDKLTTFGAVLSIFTGALVVILWEYLLLPFIDVTTYNFLPGFSIIPGFILAIIAGILGSLRCRTN